MSDDEASWCDTVSVAGPNSIEWSMDAVLDTRTIG